MITYILTILTRCSMGKKIYSDEVKKLACDMYWVERHGVVSGHKSGRYSLSDISRVTGMNRDYISKLARKHIPKEKKEMKSPCDIPSGHNTKECWRKKQCYKGTYRCGDYKAYRRVINE